MLKPAPPISNVERQRQFRARNPGYFRKYHARKRAMMKAAKAKIRELIRADAALAATEAAAAAPAPRPPLLLPAPADLPLFPGLNAIPATPARAPLPVPLPTTIAA